MKGRVGGTSRTMGLFLFVYLALLFTIVIPFHHHHDNVSHDDCPICVVAQQPCISNTVYCPQVLLGVFLIPFLFLATFKVVSRETLHLRSPPRFF